MLERTTNIEHDRQAVMSHCLYKGIQTLSLASPPVLLLLSLRSRRFSPTSFLRGLTFSTFAVGPAFGLGLGWARMNGMKDDAVRDRALRVRSNASQRRVDDKTVIGGVLGALATTTVLLKRVSFLWTIGGGASLGVAGGVIYHLVNQVQRGEDVSPDAMVEEAKEAVDKGKSK